MYIGTRNRGYGDRTIQLVLSQPSHQNAMRLSTGSKLGVRSPREVGWSLVTFQLFEYSTSIKIEDEECSASSDDWTTANKNKSCATMGVSCTATGTLQSRQLEPVYVPLLRRAKCIGTGYSAAQLSSQMNLLSK